MSDSKYDFDIAISFVNRDLGLAQEIREKLVHAFNVFVYTSKQEEVAGTDGLESFRAVFRQRSRLVAILYRDGWGRTPWTRVEEEAITDRFLAEGPSFLFVVALDESSPPPWVPEKLIRFSLADFGVEQAVGAIKARALDRGSHIQKPSTAVLARQAQEAVEFENLRSRLLKSEEGVARAGEQATRLITLVSEAADELQAEASALQIEYGATAHVIVLRTNHVSLQVVYRNQIINVLDQARLIIGDYSGSVILPEQRAYYIREPKQLVRSEYKPEFSRALGWCWRNGESVCTSEQLAEHCVQRFLSLVQQHAAGELPSLW